MDSITEIPLKQCSKCGAFKPTADYNKSSRSKDGLRPPCRECEHAHRAANIDRAREYSRNWKKNHKARDRELQKLWRQTPNGRRYALHHNNLRRNWTKGDVTTEQLTELLNRQTHCAYCKRKFTSRLRPTVDHIIPLSKGGLHTISNLVLACQPCNSRKCDKQVYLL